MDEDAILEISIKESDFRRIVKEAVHEALQDYVVFSKVEYFGCKDATEKELNDKEEKGMDN